MNILIRTSNRRNYFKRCIESITGDPNLIISVDNDESAHYANTICKESGFRYTIVCVDYPKLTIGFYNLYLNDLMAQSNDWSMILDDDDMLVDGVVEEIDELEKSEDCVYIFRIRYMGQVLPTKKRWGVTPFVRGDIGMPNFIFHPKHTELKFEAEKAGDFFFINKLIKEKTPVFVDKIIANVLQTNLGNPIDLIDLPKIHYFTPYAYDKNLGKAYNECFKNIPDHDYVCIMDGDTMFLNNDFGHQIAKTIKKRPGGAIYTCLTNRIGNPEQQYRVKISNISYIDYHKNIADNLKKTKELDTASAKKRTSMLVSVISKKVWNDIKFRDGMIGVDWDFSQRVLDAGHKIYIMQGLYVFHLYRFGQNIRNTRHLI